MSEIAELTRHLGYYLSPPDVALVERAFAFSKDAHQGQYRKSGRNVRFRESWLTGDAPPRTSNSRRYVLDVGCGTADFLRLLAPLVAPGVHRATLPRLLRKNFAA